MLEGITYSQEPREVKDHSTVSTFVRCPMKGYYQYSIHRSPIGVNYPIQFGVAYHKFREVLELIFKKNPEVNLSDRQWQRETYQLAWQIATKDYEDPPLDHKKAYLTTARLDASCNKGFSAWLHEKSTGRYIVLFTEQAFDLSLPSGKRFGGRFDQILEWNGKLWVRDFKTVSRMGRTYGEQFEPNNQMTGYCWAAQELSGRKVEGVIIDVLYNTKNQGPDLHEFLTTRTPEHSQRWIESTEKEIEDIEDYHRKQVFPMRTGACNDYSGCYFRDCCKKSSGAMQMKWLEANTTESKWDFMNPEAEEGVTD